LPLTAPLPQRDGSHIVSLRLTLLSYSQFIQEVLQAARHRQSAYACFANAHMTVEAQQQPSFAQAVNEATWVAADGVPLLWALRLLHNTHQERITGLDALPTLLFEAERHQLPVFIYGSTDEVLAQCRQFFRERHPNLPLAGMYAPPFRPLTAIEEDAVVDRISTSGAGLVFVVLGCPKQEQWMARLSARIPAVLLGVGGALPVTVGVQKRAPGWMQRAGLEWLFRLLLEPRRLFSRYLLTNSLFVYYVAKQWLQQRLVNPTSVLLSR
jgi:N-acetylglucosaminyldiphosphoundecaprenol N-acetyl-beta-D-mannosaminyltransferase